MQRAARAFNAMQKRIHDHLQERARIPAAISHDLQTPITRMKLRVEMADQPALRDKLLQDLDSMTRLVREGIALARAAEPLAEAPQRMSLNALLDSIACDYADIGKAVSFRAGKGADVMTLQPQALRRIMSNLIDNGLKYAEKVEISLSYPPNGDVIIHVVDDGPGIPEGELTAVLQPFYRLEQSRNRDTGGTGLGLAIAAQLAGQMQGSLTLHNLQQGGLEARVRLNAAVLYPSVSIPTADKSIY